MAQADRITASRRDEVVDVTAEGVDLGELVADRSGR